MIDSPAVVIIVINWEARDHTLACLASLTRLDYPAYRVLVIDNGSRDDSVAAIRAAYPQIPLIETGDNLGYVGGSNIGLEHGRALGSSYVLLLNNDTEVAPDALRLLVEAAEHDPAIGAVGPTIYHFDRADVIWSAGGAIDWAHGRTRMLGRNESDQGQFGDGPRRVDFVSGCAMLVKMSVVERVGPLDPRFFAYYEETEWCVRMARAGFRICHVPRARIWHKTLAPETMASPMVHYYMTRNRLLFLAATGAGVRAWLSTLGLEYARTLLSWSVRRKWRGRRRHRDVMLSAICDYFAGRLGRSPLDWGMPPPSRRSPIAPPVAGSATTTPSPPGNGSG